MGHALVLKKRGEERDTGSAYLFSLDVRCWKWPRGVFLNL